MTHSETTWEAGFVAGLFYQADTWAVGASVKSPQWFDTFRFNSADERGNPRNLNVTVDLPMIISVGAGDTKSGVPRRWAAAGTSQPDVVSEEATRPSSGN